jgi:hypothetical protein
VSKLKTNLDKFRSTCIKLEDKVRKSKPSPTSFIPGGMATSKGKSDQIKTEFIKTTNTIEDINEDEGYGLDANQGYFSDEEPKGPPSVEKDLKTLSPEPEPSLDPKMGESGI